MLSLLGCKKDTDSPTDILLSKTWKRNLTDKNPATNPPGRVLYYPVQNCEKDDTFRFDSEGKLTLNRGANKCSQGEQQTEIQTYSLDRNTKLFLLEGSRFTLAEESTGQLKYYTQLPPNSGYDYLVFLLE